MLTSAKYTFLLPLAFLFFMQLGRGQTGAFDHINKEPDRAASLAALEKEADKSLAKHDYAIAMYRYKQLIDIDSFHVRALKGYGESAVKATALEKAEWAYRRLVDRGITGTGGEYLLSLADVQYRLGHYEEAKESYMRFLANDKITGVTPQIIEEIHVKMDNCDWAIGLLPNSTLKTPLMLLDTNTINTVLYSEFSPYPMGDTLYFSSYKFPFEKDSRFPKRRLIKILAATYTENGFQTDTVGFNAENLHTAHICFNEKGDVMYYTIGRFTDVVDIKCEIYRRHRQPDNTWGPAEKLPDYINFEPDKYTTTEPNVGRDPVTNAEYLYFVSDRPGKGKRDIWYCRITPDSLTHPINLTELNTEGDDVTPFYHPGTNSLYFSTDARQGLGGFDVYQSKGNPGKKWETPEHLRTPINSGANDVYYVVDRAGTSIFMASNRRGSFNTSEEACCYDLFKADLVMPKMTAIAFNKATGDSLSGTVMRLIELGPDGKIVSDHSYTVAGPTQSFDLQPGKKYMIIGSKDRFSNDTVRFETPSVIWKGEIVKKLYLDPEKINLVVTVLEKDTKPPAPILGATALFYDFGPVASITPRSFPIPKSDLHPTSNQFDYKLDFDKQYKVVVSKAGYTTDSTGLIATNIYKTSTTIRDTLYLTRGVVLKAHTLDFLSKDTLYGVTYRLVDLADSKVKDQYISPIGKNYQSTIGYEHRYMLIASKENYTSDTVIITTLNLPKKEFQTILRELNLRPLDISVYLPIRLYFDNDEPDKRTMKKSTDREYRATYVDYINQKDTFIKEYTAGMSGLELQNNRDSIDYFFEKQVRNGWERLMAFSEVLYDMMTRGDTIVITLKGYASPRAGAAYNLNLTDRRVSSVYNHFDIFDGHIYRRFVKSGQLVVKREANGEAKSAKGISDDIKDKRKSIYDVRASRERRLEIIGVKVNSDKKL